MWTLLLDGTYFCFLQFRDLLTIRKPSFATICSSQEPRLIFSEIRISKTFSKDIDEKSSEVLNRQTNLEIGCQRNYGWFHQARKLSCHHHHHHDMMTSYRIIVIWYILVWVPEYDDGWQQVGLAFLYFHIFWHHMPALDIRFSNPYF